MIKIRIQKSKEAKCPAATQDLKLNTKNRDASIKAKHIQYGPLNVDEPGDYWKDIAKYWNTWAKGGPIKEDKISYEWQKRYQKN